MKNWNVLNNKEKVKPSLKINNTINTTIFFLFSRNPKMKVSLFTIFLLIIHQSSSYNSVHLLAENLEQLVTSTTLSWVSASSKSKPDYENAVIGAYESQLGT